MPDKWAQYAVSAPQGGTPPPQDTSADKWAQYAQPAQPQAAPPAAPAAPQPQRGIGGVADWMEQNPAGASDVSTRVAAGLLRNTAGGLGGIMDMVSRPKMPAAYGFAYQQDHPGSTPQEAEKSYADDYRKTFGGKISGHVQDAANWLRTGSEAHGFWENVGAIGGQVLEYMGTDGLLKMVGPAAGAVETGEHLKQAQQAAQVLKNNPKLAGLVAVGLKASKEAAMQAAQTYVHTEDTGQALAAGAMGGVMHVGGEALAAGLGKAAQVARRVGPKSLDIAGEKVPALAAQLNERGVPIETGAEAAPGIAAQQAAAGPKVVENLAQRAARNVLERINATRMYETNPARLLPAATEGAGPTFTVGLGGEGVERQEGELMQSAAKRQQAAFKEPQYLTGGAPTRTATEVAPGKVFHGPEGTMGADISTATTPEPRQDILGGTPSMQTKDPERAQGWLSEFDRIQDHPLCDSLPQARKDAIEESRTNLEHQLGMYHAGQSVNYPLRMPVNIDSAINQVGDWGSASDQIENAIKPIFAAFDPESRTALSDQFVKYKRALGSMKDATGDGFDAAEREMEEADQEINRHITANAGNVSREEYQVAREGWRDKVFMDKLHAVTERMMNGVTAKEAEEGSTRLMRQANTHTRKFEDFLTRQQNRPIMERLVGADGIQNFKNMTKLMSSAQAPAAKEASRNVAVELGKYALKRGMAGAVAHVIGLPSWVGIGTAEGVTQGMRFVMRQAVTNPRVGQLLEYAARQGVDAKVYAPLIARTIMVPTQENQQPQQEGQQ